MSKAFLPTILEQKEKEVAQLVMEDLQPLRQTYRLYEFLKSNQNKLQIISEVKKASPSMGDINLDVDIVAQAKTYEENGAAMISVLTDEVFFKGDISYLKEISSQNWKWLIVLVLRLSVLTTVIWLLLRQTSIPVLSYQRISRTSLFIFLSQLFSQVRMLP